MLNILGVGADQTGPQGGVDALQGCIDDPGQLRVDVIEVSNHRVCGHVQELNLAQTRPSDLRAVEGGASLWGGAGGGAYAEGKVWLSDDRHLQTAEGGNVAGGTHDGLATPQQVLVHVVLHQLSAAG